MFILPFLKYFRPHLARLLIAIPCMVLVGIFSVTPLLIGREAFNVFLEGGWASRNELQDVKGISKNLVKLGGLSEEAQPEGDQAKPGPAAKPREWSKPATGKPIAKAPKVKPAKEESLAGEILGGLNQSLERWGGRPYVELRAWGQARLVTYDAWHGTFRAWYRQKYASEPLKVLEFLALLLVITTAIKGAAEFLSKYELSYTFFLTNLKIREDIFGNILQQDYLYFNSNSPGYLHSRINSDVKAVRAILEGMLSDGIQQPITILSTFCVLLYLHARLTLGVMIVLPLIAGLLYYFAKVLRKNANKQKKKEDELSSGLTESLTNIRLVKAFGTESIEMGKFHERTMALFRFMMARRMAKFGSSPMMEFIGSVATGGIIIMGGWMILNHSLKFADFFIYMVTLSRFYRPLKSLANLNTKFQEAEVSNKRMLQMLALKPKLINHTESKPFGNLKDGIEFEQVGFRYDNKQILESITLRVQAGQKVALAGPSGGGKTTLVNMLARLFDPSEGRILIDGVDLKEIEIADWRQHLAIVTQDTYLFDDTVENNISYGMGAINREQVESAARAANAHDFIMQLDGGLGYKTKIGPTGGRLSGGQRQRLAIARAIYRDPKILILDEATSALDAQSQAIVQEALNHLMVGRTTFIIAHRTSTIRNVDCIYVIDQGRITESGTHDQLMAGGGTYHSMVTKVGLIKNEANGDETADESSASMLSDTDAAWPDATLAT